MSSFLNATNSHRLVQLSVLESAYFVASFVILCLQTVSCTNAPSFDVECIECNYTGTHIYIAGRHGISVILLPQTCGQLRKLDGNERTLARCVCYCCCVAAKATYIRLLHGKIGLFGGFFGPSSVKRGRTHIVLG